MNPGQPISLRGLLPDWATPEQAYILLAAAAAFVLVLALGNAYFERDKHGPRLKAIQERRKELRGEYIRPRKKAKGAEAGTDMMRGIIARLKFLQIKRADLVQTKLVQAGYRSKDAMVIYTFAKAALPLIGVALGAIFSDMDWRQPFAVEAISKWLAIIGPGYAGARLPDFIVARARSKRYDAVRRSLADTLDLLLICAEAGLSLPAALDRVAKELGQAYPEMAEELGLTSVEVGFLPERSTALKHFAQRNDIQEVRSMVNVLLQTEKYGTPIAQALRVLSKEFRTERMLRAEQKAARLPALMTVPMILFILPTLFIIIMAPAVIGVLDLKR